MSYLNWIAEHPFLTIVILLIVCDCIATVRGRCNCDKGIEIRADLD